MSSISALLWQTALLLFGAYFLGTFLGCWLRRRLNAPPRVAMESRADTSVVERASASIAAGSSDRFGRALDGSDRSTSAPARVSAGAQPQVNEPAASPPSPSANNGDDRAPMRDNKDDAPAEAVVPEAPEPARAVPVAPVAALPSKEPPPARVVAAATTLLAQIPREEPPPTPITAASEQPKPMPSRPLTPPMSAAAAAAAARAARQAASNRSAATPPQPAPPEPGRPDVSVADKMETLDPPIASDLPAPSGSTGQASVAAQIEPAATVVTDGPDDLTLIKGVTDADVAVLQDAGFTTFSAITRWTAQDVARVNANITGGRRIGRENWIEQAQLLQNGGSTAHTRAVLASLAPRPEAVVADVSDDADPVTSAASVTASDEGDDDVADLTTSSPPDPTEDTATASPPEATAGSETVSVSSEPYSPEVSQRAAFARERRGYADDLQQIDGINAEVEKLLNEQGVTRVAQIAGWPASEQERIDRLLGGMNRVRRENWVGQARRISGFSEAADNSGGDPDAQQDSSAEHVAAEASIERDTSSLNTVASDEATDTPATNAQSDEPDVPESNVLPLGSDPSGPRNNVRNFRSVRSEALVGTPSIDPHKPGDDLKRIRGIGVLIEKRLRAMGYTSYEQIGSWTQSDVDRVNQKLDFRGRIERENWIEQARILAAGGQTEFSRRQERDDN